MAVESTERVVPAGGVPLAGARVVASQFQFYLDGTDNLRLEAWSAGSTAYVQVFGRYRDDAGDVKTFEASVGVTSDRLPHSRDVPAIRGYILNLVVYGVGASDHYGDTFVKVSIIRGLTGGIIVLGTLLQGYVTTRQSLAFPGSSIAAMSDFPGYLTEVISAGALPGQNMIFTCPVNTRWDVLKITASLLTDATVVNRRPYVLGTVLSNTPYCHHVQQIPASTARVFHWARGLTGNIDTAAIPNTSAMPDPNLVEYPGLMTVSATGLVAGDQFLSGSLVALERLEVN